MTAAGGSVAIGVRLENWSGYTLTQVIVMVAIWSKGKESRLSYILPKPILTHSPILIQPEFVPNYGSASAKLPVVSVGPGIVELAVLKQEQVFPSEEHIVGS